MKTCLKWIRRRPVGAFFALTYALSWPLLILVFRVFPGNMAAQGTLGSVATFAPALAAMIVAGVTDPRKQPRRRTQHWIAFGITWILAGVSLAGFIVHVRRAPLVVPIILLSGVLAILPADLASGDSRESILFNRLVFNAVWSILFVWIFNRTGGSILAPAVFHPAMNTSGGLLPRTNAATVLFIALAVGVVLRDRMWRMPEDTDMQGNDAEHTTAAELP